MALERVAWGASASLGMPARLLLAPAQAEASWTSGAPVRSRGEAAYVLGVSPEIARAFVQAWDRLWGSNRRRARLLRDALARVERLEDEASRLVDWDQCAQKIEREALVLD